MVVVVVVKSLTKPAKLNFTFALVSMALASRAASLASPPSA